MGKKIRAKNLALSHIDTMQIYHNCTIYQPQQIDQITKDLHFYFFTGKDNQIKYRFTSMLG